MITDSLQKSITLILFPILFSIPSFGQIYVDVDASAGGDGTTWSSAYDNLQTALLAATSGDQVWVAEGTYTIIGDEDTSFEIPSGVAVYGGFTGSVSETSLSDRDWANNLTSLDGQNLANSIVYFENSSNTTILDGFTIENGYADGTNQRGQSGSGIYMDIVAPGAICDPQILNCTIKNNYSDKGGGAVYIDGSWVGIAAPSFDNCTFDSNDSYNDGGAIYANGIWGGAVNANYYECTFINNHSVGSGGALFGHGGHGDVSSVFRKCNFDSNEAEGNGGAMYSLGTSGGKANHTIINSRFYKNKGYAAGGIYNNGGNSGGDASPTITNCTFYLNEATGIDPSTGNPAGTGGAIYNNGSNGGQSNTQIKNCIIWGNIAPYGTHVIKNVYCSPTISYCLVDAEDCDELDNGSGSAVICGSGILYELGNDPDFENAATGNLRISTDSDAKNAGNNSGILEVDDLDGNDRFVDAIDMGAYENATSLLPVELLSFEANAKGGIVVLEWTTLSEEDHDRFEVEKSTDGVSFDRIAILDGAGNTTSFSTYEALDQAPEQGDNYYRLKIVSFSGAIEYSPIQIVRFETDAIHFYPNPVKEVLNIGFGASAQAETEAKFELYSIYGKRLHSGTLNMNTLEASINISSLNLVPGTYLLSIHLANQQSVHQRFQTIQ